MQPRFPADHHFYDRHRRRPSTPSNDHEITALADQAIRYLTRQCIPAYDASDPRSQPSG